MGKKGEEKPKQSNTGFVAPVTDSSTYVGDYMKTIQIDAFPDRIQTGVASNIGDRDYQQDAVIVENDYVYNDTGKMIAVLCDGMGGLSGGEIASNICVNTLYKHFQEKNILGNVSDFLESEIAELDKTIINLKNANQKPLNAGTTLACIVIIEDKLYWASVGDSRIYTIGGGEMVQVTVDHNYLMLLEQKVKKGEITEEEAYTNPKREALVSYIGMGGVQYISLNAMPVQLLSGDYIVICSDGLYRSLEETEIKEVILTSDTSMTETANVLISKAIGKQKMYQDNATVVIVKYLG